VGSISLAQTPFCGEQRGGGRRGPSGYRRRRQPLRVFALDQGQWRGDGTGPTVDRARSPAPEDGYGRSKLQAELALRALADETGLDLVILRPSLIYGSGVGGNFAQMVCWVQRGLPLPLGAVDTKRTLLALPNLIDPITATLTRAGAANQVLLAGDTQDLSTPELLGAIGAALGRGVRLLPCCPPPFDRRFPCW
jgi:nucleoside-diphosphate-sugar epimerase